jgi:molybdate transport system permease protein
MIEEWPILWLSIQTAFFATFLLLPFGIGLGWILARKNFWGKSLIEAFVQLPLVLPPVVTGYFLLLLLGPMGYIGAVFHNAGIRIAFSWFAAVLAAAIVSLPLMVRTIRISMSSIDIRLEETARTLGASETNIFLRITLPLALPGIIAGSLLSFARSLGEFGATIVFAGNIPGQTQTIPLAIFQYINQPNGMSKAHNLVLAAILFSYASMLFSEWMLKKATHADN